MDVKKGYGKVTFHSFVNEVFKFFGETDQKNVAASSASVAFYSFISIIPLFVLLCSLMPLTNLSKDELTHMITNITPDGIDSLIASIINEAYSKKISLFSSISVIFLIWSSSKAMQALIRAVDKIYGRPYSRNFFILIGFSVLYTVSTIFLAGELLRLYTTGRSFVGFLGRFFLSSKEDFDFFLDRISDYVALLGLTFIIALICTVAPAGKRKLRYQLPGAFFASASIILFTMFYAKYSTGNNMYNSFYGSLSSVAIFLLWIYACINLFLMGCVFNVKYEDGIVKFFNKTKIQYK